MSELYRYRTGTKEISFMAHPETLLLMPTIDDPLERFLSVVKFYLSGWHIKPPWVLALSLTNCC